ncbi:MAG TPA: hypothetical protein VIK86_06990 [Candidatus Paceibacterota bacterium]
MSNKILSVLVIILSIMFANDLVSKAFIINDISHWSYYLIFLIALLLIIVSRFKEIKDKTGIHLTYIGLLSFIIAPFLPMFINFICHDLSCDMEGSFSLIFYNFLPAVGLIMSVCVAIRLLLNKKAEIPHNGELYI